MFLRTCALLLVAGLVPSACARALPDEAVVRRVIDGDTVQIVDGRLVRYLGIDAPEIRRRDGTSWVVDPEPYGEAAKAFNERLVEGKRVRLEYDVRTTDRFGRLLCYVYVGDRMVNAWLLEAGLAEPLVIEPNVKYAAEFRALAEESHTAGRGLWSQRAADRSPSQAAGKP